MAHRRRLSPLVEQWNKAEGRRHAQPAGQTRAVPRLTRLQKSRSFESAVGEPAVTRRPLPILSLRRCLRLTLASEACRLSLGLFLNYASRTAAECVCSPQSKRHAGTAVNGCARRTPLSEIGHLLREREDSTRWPPSQHHIFFSCTHCRTRSAMIVVVCVHRALRGVGFERLCDKRHHENVCS